MTAVIANCQWVQKGAADLALLTCTRASAWQGDGCMLNSSPVQPCALSGPHYKPVQSCLASFGAIHRARARFTALCSAARWPAIFQPPRCAIRGSGCPARPARSAKSCAHSPLAARHRRRAGQTPHLPICCCHQVSDRCLNSVPRPAAPVRACKTSNVASKLVRGMVSRSLPAVFVTPAQMCVKENGLTQCFSSPGSGALPWFWPVPLWQRRQRR